MTLGLVSDGWDVAELHFLSPVTKFLQLNMNSCFLLYELFFSQDVHRESAVFILPLPCVDSATQDCAVLMPLRPNCCPLPMPAKLSPPAGCHAGLT